MKAPSWDHYRNWQFIVLHTKEEKEHTFSYAKFIADRFDLSRYEGRKLNLAQEMYAYAMPRQYTMLADCPYFPRSAHVPNVHPRSRYKGRH